MSDKSQFAQFEEEILALWEKEDTFSQSIKQREGKETFSFYDGPPFANGLPHFGHSLVQSIKDSILRYKTMRGYYVPRRNGWDCHGLPVEFEIEQQFKVSGKKQIMELGLDKFNAACRASIFKYKDEWEGLLKRIGRWSEYDNYYATVDSNYTESVWWTLKQIHDKGLVHRGLRALPYCPRCATPLSNFELNEGYKDDVKDPSFFVDFPLSDGRELVAWTTTPWSLGGNTALAVNPKAQYATVEITDDNGDSRQLIVAEKRLEMLKQKYKLVKKESGNDLVGKSYSPIYQLDKEVYPQLNDTNIYKVWAADFVSIEDGTGVLHVAPATGVDDLELSNQNDIPVIHAVDENGNLLGGIGFDEVKGVFFKEADRLIIEELTKRGRVYAAETLKHTYPFCWRCETPLMYYAITAWMVGVSKIREQLLRTAADINWVPANIKDGRFGKWLEGARDWTISRNRYWGAPMPIWQNVADKDDYIVVGSIAELKQLAGDKIKVKDLHRPFIDEITFEKDGKTYKRIEEVIDCWFESGSMSVAQLHYPFENQQQFKQTFPADFIIEGLDQTRLWFYVQHVVATILFDKPAFKNVVVNGMIMAGDGQKLSKRLRNYPPIEEVFDKEGADSLRLFLLSSVQATETADYMRFNRDGLRDTQRNVLMTWWNSYRFFSMYAETENWNIHAASELEPTSKNLMDQWIIARLNQTIAESTKQADQYHIAKAIQPVFELVDDMSNWYVRRSRRRFWKNDDEADKQSAFATLQYVLLRLCQLMAPWAPFLSDKIYRELKPKGLPASVHLTDWPKAHKFEPQILTSMREARETINIGLAQRAEAQIKVRQPLASVTAPIQNKQIVQIVIDELNVKKLRAGKKVSLDTKISQTLRIEGIAREVIRHVQQYRKELGLNVSDKIRLTLDTDNGELKKALQAHNGLIAEETISSKLAVANVDQGKPVSIDGIKLKLAVKKEE